MCFPTYIFFFTVAFSLVGCEFVPNYTRIDYQEVIQKDKQISLQNFKSDNHAIVNIILPDETYVVPGSSVTLNSGSVNLVGNQIQTLQTGVTTHNPAHLKTKSRKKEQQYIEGLLNETLQRTKLFKLGISTFLEAKKMYPGKQKMSMRSS